MVVFQGHFKFSVQGSLIAEGTLNNSIRFTINDTTGFHDINIPNGGWHGIRFGYGVPGTDSSRISYCSFSYGKAMGSIDMDKAGGAVAIANAADYGGAIQAETNCSPMIRNNLIFSNYANQDDYCRREIVYLFHR